MRRSRATPLAAACAVLLALAGSMPGRADDERFSFRRRGSNRSEGIVTSNNVSGEIASLVAIHLRPAGGPVDFADTERLYLRIPRSPDGLRSVEVRETDRNYLMKPETAANEAPSDGAPCETAPLHVGGWFCWPTADVIRPARISAVRLRADAVDAKGEVRLPAVLSPSRAGFEPAGYEFHLHATATLEGKWWIAQPGDDGRLDRISEPREIVPRSGPTTLFWAPTPEAISEVLHFVFKGRVHTQPPRRHRMDVPFVHAMARK
jgi:hypothetical protein